MLSKKKKKYVLFISDKFDLGPEYGATGNSYKHPVTYNYRVYSRVDTDDDIVKHKLYTPKNTDRSR